VVRRLRGLPAMLRVSGVPATIAFAESRARSGGDLGKAYEEVAKALRGQLAATLGWPVQPAQLYAKMRDASAADLACGFVRLDAFAGWLRRLAEAAPRVEKPIKASGVPAGEARSSGPATGEASSGGPAAGEAGSDA